MNLYGPRDDFDLKSSYVNPAIIRKCVEDRERDEETIVAWGTGDPTREFLYVKDAAEGILDATERIDRSELVNLGSGIEISTRDLVQTIAEMSGFVGEIRWDSSKPSGQMRRRLDVSKSRGASNGRLVPQYFIRRCTPYHGRVERATSGRVHRRLNQPFGCYDVNVRYHFSIKTGPNLRI